MTIGKIYCAKLIYENYKHMKKKRLEKKKKVSVHLWCYFNLIAEHAAVIVIIIPSFFLRLLTCPYVYLSINLFVFVCLFVSFILLLLLSWLIGFFQDCETSGLNLTQNESLI